MLLLLIRMTRASPKQCRWMQNFASRKKYPKWHHSNFYDQSCEVTLVVNEFQLDWNYSEMVIDISWSTVDDKNSLPFLLPKLNRKKSMGHKEDFNILSPPPPLNPLKINQVKKLILLLETTKEVLKLCVSAAVFSIDGPTFWVAQSDLIGWRKIHKSFWASHSQ